MEAMCVLILYRIHDRHRTDGKAKRYKNTLDSFASNQPYIHLIMGRPVPTACVGGITPPGTISVGTGPNLAFLSANKQTCHLRR